MLCYLSLAAAAIAAVGSVIALTMGHRMRRDALLRARLHSVRREG